MEITQLVLKNYRNYKDLDVSNFGNLNIICGMNATGKTNLIESIYLCGIGKPYKTIKDKELILWAEKSCYIKIVVKKKYREHTIEIYIDEYGKKRISVDKLNILKLASLLGTLNIVYFSPDELRLIKDAPSDRRKFLDISICQQNKRYLNALSSYTKILEQRNKLLKSGMKESSIMETLPIWDIQLANQCAIVCIERYLFIEILKKFAIIKHNYLTSNKEILNIEYETDAHLNCFIDESSKNYSEVNEYANNFNSKNYSANENISQQDNENSKKINNANIEKENDLNNSKAGDYYFKTVKRLEEFYKNLYLKNRKRDMEFKYTSVGVHRDDLNITINNSIDVRRMGSQGQQRTVALSLKLAETEIFKEITKESPILLLDDVLSELDSSRTQKLIELCSNAQTFITTTSWDKKQDNEFVFITKA